MAIMYFLRKYLAFLFLLHLFGIGHAMPHRELIYNYENDLTQFMNSLRAFVGEVSGLLNRPEHYEEFGHMATTGFGYLDSLHIFSNRMAFHLDAENAELIFDVQEILRQLVNLLEIASNVPEDVNDIVHTNESMNVGRTIGRQKIPISQLQIEMLQEIGFTWVQMANIWVYLKGR